MLRFETMKHCEVRTGSAKEGWLVFDGEGSEGVGIDRCRWQGVRMGHGMDDDADAYTRT